MRKLFHTSANADLSVDTVKQEFFGGRVVAYCGDCLSIMSRLPQSVDMVLCDLPYGTTYASWDSVIPMSELWPAYERVVKEKAAIVLTAAQPFTSMLVMSRPSWFRCSWVWDKVNSTNFSNAKRQPMKVHEDVLVFASGQTTYNPQKTQGKKNHAQGSSSTSKATDTKLITSRAKDDLSGMKYPKSIQTFATHSSQVGLHPTQKPVPLFEYFIRTYSNEGETVLDNCAGSGTCGIAAIRTGRRAILIEKDPSYFSTLCSRLREEEQKKPSNI